MMSRNGTASQHSCSNESPWTSSWCEMDVRWPHDDRQAGTRRRRGLEAGFDCSGLIGSVYRQSAGIAPPRTVAQISRWGQSVSAGALRAGDLVIFGERGSPSHAAIHAREERFVHAPGTGGTVRLNGFGERYWKTRLLDFRRA